MLRNEELLVKLRKIISDDSWPISIDDWQNSWSTNCLAFALGLDYPDPKEHSYYGSFGSICSAQHLFTRSEIASSDLIQKTFIETCQLLGLNCRHISSPNEAQSFEYIIGVFGMYPCMNSVTWRGDPIYQYDFHLVRRNLDGTWVHKPGWYDNPEKVEWKCLQLLYPERPLYFAVHKPNGSSFDQQEEH